MKQYTIGKKAEVIVLHQLCMILMVTGVFATGYAFRHDAHENIDIYTLISLAGLVGSFVSLAYMANVADRGSERMCEYPRRSAWKASREASNVVRHC